MAELTKAMSEFLSALAPHKLPVPRSKLRRSATRDEDKARQACRRAGYVEFVGGRLLDDGKDYPMGWRLTPAGRTALKDSANG